MKPTAKAQGLVYVCSWEKLAGGGIRGIITTPKIRVDADTLDGVLQELRESITDATGDCVPIIELEPPLPPSGNFEWFRDGLVVVDPSSHFQIENVARIFDGGLCEQCEHPRGKRTTDPIWVESIWPGDASVSWDSRSLALHVLLISERLLDEFSNADRQIFDVRAVIMPSGKRKKFVEIVPTLLVPEVAIDSLEVSGWHCNECGHVQFSHGNELGWGVPAISRNDLPESSLFFVGSSTNYRLCMKPDLCKKMKPALRKATMSSEPVAVVGPEQIAKYVEVPEIEEVHRRNSEK